MQADEWPVAATVNASVGAQGSLTAGCTYESLVESRLDAAQKVLNVPSRRPGTESDF